MSYNLVQLYIKVAYRIFFKKKKKERITDKYECLNEINRMSEKDLFWNFIDKYDQSQFW